VSENVVVAALPRGWWRGGGRGPACPKPERSSARARSVRYARPKAAVVGPASGWMPRDAAAGCQGTPGAGPGERRRARRCGGSWVPRCEIDVGE